MIFRKPYAFLIKNFKKIHFLLLVLWVFIFYKLYGLRDFIKEYITYGTYNKNLEGIGTKIGFLLYFSIFVSIVISILLLFLLLYKKKPWKLYLVIVIEYIFMFYALVSVSSYFNSLTPISNISGVFFYRDLINISFVLFFLVLVILILRIAGADIKKFGFSGDKEFLELSSADREEFEISFDIDKHSFKRKYNSIKRNIGYFYEEHKKLCNTVLIAGVVIIVGLTVNYFSKTRSYKMGDTFTAGIYDITVNDVFITNKDSMGNVIEKGNKFVIINVTLKNRSSENVEPNFNRFHLMNRNINRTNTVYYDDYFKDIGRGLSSDSGLKASESKKFTLVYKTPSSLKDKNYVLYYQEYHGKNSTFLRKIKLKINNISKIDKTYSYKLGDKITFKDVSNNSNSVIFENISFEQSSTYNKYVCHNGEKCEITSKNISVDNNHKILKISFASSDYEGEEFVDFTSRCAIIKYVDSNGKTKTNIIDNTLVSNYEGKEIFIKVDNNVSSSNEVYLDYLIRNKRYVVRIK